MQKRSAHDGIPDLREIKHTVQIHSASRGDACPICGDALYSGSGRPVAPAINHMLDHGYRILHIGSEFARSGEGKAIQHTVAILGTSEMPEALMAGDLGTKPD